MNNNNNTRTESDIQLERNRAYKALAAGAVGALFLGPIGAFGAAWLVDKCSEQSNWTTLSLFTESGNFLCTHYIR